MLLAVGASSPAFAGSCKSDTCRERVARKQCARGQVRSCILRAAYTHHQPYGDLLRVAYCESTLNPRATNGTHLGLFQFLPSTWATTRYARRDPWSAKWNALAAAWMWRVGRRGEWACR